MSNSYYEPYQGQYRVIPGAGTYLQDQAKAQNAYQRAKAQLQANRAKTQIGAGLGKDWSVDPNAQYGSYQQMLQGQGGALDQASQMSQERGLMGAGLGNQGESMLRYGQAVESLGFKNNLADYESGYQSQLGDLERQKQEADLAALQNSYQDAYQGGDYTPYDPTASPSDVAPPPTARPTAAVRKVYGRNTGRGVYRDSQGRLNYKGVPKPKPRTYGTRRSGV